MSAMSGLRSFATKYSSLAVAASPFVLIPTYVYSSDSVEEDRVVKNANPRTTAAGFDPEALERGAKALRELNASPYAKRVFELMKKQEETRQAEEKTKTQEFAVMQAQQETERQKVVYEEQRKLQQANAQTKAQLQRYEDELARKRMQADHEAQRQRNAELVQLQEESSLRQEQTRRATEERIQQQRRQTEQEGAEIERETLRVKALAEAEGRAHEARLSEDVNRRLLMERAGAEREKWVAAINATFGHIGGGLRDLLTDQNKAVVAVTGLTALAAGVYGTREGSRVLGRYVDRVLGQPALVRETSKGRFPWSRFFTRSPLATAGAEVAAAATAGSAARVSAAELMKQGKGFGDVILPPGLYTRLRQLAAATANTKQHGAPFRNMMFYGPPGTGKTMAAKELARQSGLEYALMTGGDVAPLGATAVTKIHQLFDWATRSQRGLLLFIDEADAFLCQRNNVSMSEAQRSALNALLFRTGDQSRDLVLVLATNRPKDLDTAILDRVDEAIEFPLPGEDERLRLLKLYMRKYIEMVGGESLGMWASIRKTLGGREQVKVEVKGITEEVLKEAARKTEGFSGRELAKLLASVRGAVYGGKESVLTSDVFREVVDYKVAEHQQRRNLSVEGGG